LVYTEQLELAQDLQYREFARRVLGAWIEFEPDNAAVRKMLTDLGTSDETSKSVDGAAK